MLIKCSLKKSWYCGNIRDMNKWDDDDKGQIIEISLWFVISLVITALCVILVKGRM